MPNFSKVYSADLELLIAVERMNRLYHTAQIQSHFSQLFVANAQEVFMCWLLPAYFPNEKET
jgi:hypothetical protein